LLLNPLAKLMLSGGVKDGDCVEVMAPEAWASSPTAGVRFARGEEEPLAGEEDGRLVIRVKAKPEPSGSPPAA
jgi:hypothetical protein